MNTAKTLRSYGLFDARVPRYTSYPPANRFESGTGALHQADWLASINPAEPVSVYIHIPFCRRLCWFCACRTQGTKTLKPVDAYLADLVCEISTVTARIPSGLKMSRLHIGGGTPTLLTAPQMHHLLGTVFAAFDPAEDFEFSVEIDPTEAEKPVLAELANWGMNRASIGVQDFNPAVQMAIGRLQSLAQTERAVAQLRILGVESLNIDLLYGLPFQTAETMQTTLDQVITLRPDRLALYGYAHVPHMSKRQAMIDADRLPDAEARFAVSQMAENQLVQSGYLAVGIDHFALPHDRLATAQASGTLRRNFQGYTDDTCTTLLGFGASAISTFAQGYTQNAAATAEYQRRVQHDGITADKGHVLSPRDRLVSDMISALMCVGEIDLPAISARHPDQTDSLDRIIHGLAKSYSLALSHTPGQRLTIKPGFACMSRLIAAQIDQQRAANQIHSLAI